VLTGDGGNGPGTVSDDSTGQSVSTSKSVSTGNQTGTVSDDGTVSGDDSTGQSVSGDGGGGDGGTSDSDGGGGDGHSSGGGVDGVGNTDSLGHSDGLDVGVSPLLNHWGLDNVLDLVDWVGLLDADWDWDIDLVGLGDWLLNDDGPLNGGWDWDGHINLELVDVQLGDDLGPLWGDDGVGASQAEDGLVDDGVSGGGAQVPGWRGDGSHWGWHGGSWDGDGHGVDRVGGWALDQGVCWGLVDGGAGNVVLVSDLDGAGTGVDGAVSNDSVLDVGLSDGGSGVDVLLDMGGALGVSDVSTDDSTSDSSDSSDSSDRGSDGSWGGGKANCSWGPVSGGSSAQSSAESSQNQKSSHDVFLLLLFRVNCLGRRQSQLLLGPS